MFKLKLIIAESNKTIQYFYSNSGDNPFDWTKILSYDKDKKILNIIWITTTTNYLSNVSQLPLKEWVDGIHFGKWKLATFEDLDKIPNLLKNFYVEV
jgi:hypothetical protein